MVNWDSVNCLMSSVNLYLPKLVDFCDCPIFNLHLSVARPENLFLQGLGEMGDQSIKSVQVFSHRIIQW